jgi:hypothetical protein
LLPLVKSMNLKEGTRLQLQRRFYQTAPIWDLSQIGHIYPSCKKKCGVRFLCLLQQWGAFYFLAVTTSYFQCEVSVFLSLGLVEMVLGKHIFSVWYTKLISQKLGLLCISVGL